MDTDVRVNDTPNADFDLGGDLAEAETPFGARVPTDILESEKNYAHMNRPKGPRTMEPNYQKPAAQIPHTYPLFS